MSKETRLKYSYCIFQIDEFLGYTLFYKGESPYCNQTFSFQTWWYLTSSPHTTYSQNSMHEKRGHLMANGFDIKMVVKGDAIETVYKC